MAVVKGSKVYQWTVVKSRPYARTWQVVALCALVAAAVTGAFVLGQYLEQSSDAIARQELTTLRTELDEVRKAEQRLRQQRENAKLGAEVDRKSLEEVRQEVIDLRAALAALKEENQFYRNLMSPDLNARGLSFGPIEIVQTERPRSFRYKVVVQQLATQHELLTGTLRFSVVGRQDGEAKTLALKELSASVDGNSVPLRFKYFQNIEGELVLPEGFEPERIELEARPSGSNSTAVEKRLAWLVHGA
jgi:hypothetical protein